MPLSSIHIARTVLLASPLFSLVKVFHVWDVEKQRSYADQAKLILKSCGDANKQLAYKLDKLINEILANL